MLLIPFRRKYHHLTPSYLINDLNSSSLSEQNHAERCQKNFTAKFSEASLMQFRRKGFGIVFNRVSCWQRGPASCILFKIMIFTYF